jgi:hypothetical protein
LALLLASSGAQYPALPMIPNLCHETSSSNKKTWNIVKGTKLRWKQGKPKKEPNKKENFTTQSSIYGLT